MNVCHIQKQNKTKQNKTNKTKQNKKQNKTKNKTKQNKKQNKQKTKNGKASMKKENWSYFKNNITILSKLSRSVGVFRNYSRIL